MKERLCGGEGDRGPVPFPSIHVKKNAKEKKYPTACNSGTLHTHTHTHTHTWTKTHIWMCTTHHICTCVLSVCIFRWVRGNSHFS